jgi:phosphatidylglycerophosphatase A
MTTSAPDGTVEPSHVSQLDDVGSERKDPPAGQPEEWEKEPGPAGVSSQTMPPGINSIRPSKAFVRSRLPYFIAFGGGAGLSPYAPGTMGTLAAFPLFWILTYFFDPLALLVLVASMFLIGIWACGVTGRALGNHDHGGMVWDEITAFTLVLLFTPPIVTWQVFAFLLFRLFDIIKPPPIGYYDRRLRGGFGVMFDDLLAAFLTLLCLAAWKALGMGSMI